MSDSTIEQVRDKLDIVEVVSSYLKLEKTGINHRAPCPFHSEKKPSFFVSPARQSFKCFGCSESGSVFDFVMKIEGIEFGDALRMLAKRAGVQLKSFSPELQTKRQRLYEICEISCSFFEKQLQGSLRGNQAKKYLLSRGITEETIKKFRLGYAPLPVGNNWRALSDFLVGRGYTREEVVEAGLAVISDKSQTPYDRFRGRIMFSVFDLNGQIIGFGGRIFGQDEDTAKYLNIPNTPLYDKSNVLYGLNFGKMSLRKNNACILMEGYTDVILAHQAGYDNAVASSGTALTANQLSIIKRYTKNLLTAFDMDNAGGMATKRGIDMALSQDFDVKIITMPTGCDPADVITQDIGEWERLVQGAKEIMPFYFESAMSSFDKTTPNGKKQIAQAILPSIKKISNKIAQFHWVQKLASELNVSEQSILEELQKTSLDAKQYERRQTYGEAGSQNKPVIEVKTKNRKQLLEEQALGIIMEYPKCLLEVDSDALQYFSKNVQEIIQHFQKSYSEKANDLQSAARELSNNNEYKVILNSCFFQDEDLGEQTPQEEFALCLKQIFSIATKDKLKRISSQIQAVENSDNADELKGLIQQFDVLSKSRSDLGF